MERQLAATLLRRELDKFNLKDWKIRIIADLGRHFLAMCSYKDTTIILNAHHVDLHDEKEILNSIHHEIAHALCPGHGHNEVWKKKAAEVGCYNTDACASYGLPEDIIDAIRSGAQVEVTFDEKVIRTPRFEVTRLQEKCEFCGKIAVTKTETKCPVADENKPDLLFRKLECGHTLIKKIPKGTPFHKLTTNYLKFKDCPHEFIKNKCEKCGQFKPFQFQVDGMRFIESALAVRHGAGIFDEMGLGKTIQSVGYMRFHPELHPTLYIVKSALKYQWAKAIIDWMGDEYVPQVVSSSNEWLIPNLKSYIVSYDMLVFKIRKNKKGKEIKQGFDITQFDRVGIKSVVLDECQQIKNTDSSRTQQVRRVVRNRKVIALSGTPWKNRGSEFFSVLNMLDPMKFSSQMNFIERWVHKEWNGKFMKEGGIRNIPAFKEYVKDLVIRRERTEVMKELPLINRMKLFIQMNDIEQEAYDDATSDFVKWYNDYITGNDGGAFESGNILAQLSRMRHIAGLAKIPATEEFIESFVDETDRKLCVFVHHIDVGELLYNSCVDKYGTQMPILKITGSMNALDRFETQKKFNESSRCIMIASTLAAGEGLNLQTGADCVLHERQWNPANEEQAEGRFIRIGQTASSVNATYVLSEGSIDVFFDEIVDQKRGQFHAAMNKGEAPQWNQGDIAKQLAEMIVKKWKEKKRKVS